MTKAKALTEKLIESIKPSATRVEIPDGTIPGLYLIVQPSGAKSWAVRYRISGRTKKITLGPVSVLKLSEARAQALISLAELNRGIDPSVARKSVNRIESDTFCNVATEFLKRQAIKNRIRSSKETERLFLKEILPRFGHRPIQQIHKRDVIRLLDDIVDRGRGTTANRVLAAMRAFFNWCLDRDIIIISPTTRVKPPARENKRDRVLSDQELKVFWIATGHMGYPFGPLLKLLLATGQRLSEVGGMTAGEISGALWTLPAPRAKTNIEHFIPLSPLAMEIIQELPKEGLLFTTTGLTPVSGWSRAKEILDNKMHRLHGMDIPSFTIHDLRRTAATGMARLGIDPHIIELILNHRTGIISGVTAVYNRYNFMPEKEIAMREWGSHIKMLTVTGEPSA